MTHEDALIQRMARGDPAAANELIETLYPEILRYCLRHAPDPSLAEDAAQETFLKALRYFDRYTHKGHFKSFLYRIAANTCIDMQRKSSRSDVSLEEASIDPAQSDSAFEDVQSDMTLRQLVSCLPEDTREIVLLRFGHDLTMREIADVLHMPLRTVQSKLRAGLKKLRDKLAPLENS